MAKEDVETLRVGYEAFNRGDWSATFSGAHPDFEMKTADRVTSPGTYRGVEQARKFFEDFFEPFDEVKVEVEEFIERGDCILALVVVRSRPRGSQAAVENRIGHLWTIRDGQFFRFEIFPKREDALAAIGLSADDVRTSSQD